MKTATSFGKRAMSFLLAFLMTFSLLNVGASASTIEDGSKTASMTLGPGHFYLKTTAGTSLGAWGYTYTTNDGLTGPAYCVNHGLHFTNRTLPIDGKYTSSPKTAGVFANGYPQHSIDTFLGLYLSSNPILSGLTADEYAYATQLAIWATLGQLGIEGTPFTSGREQIAQPTGDTQQMRVFRVVQLLLNVANSWTFVPQTGMYIRTDENRLGGNVSVPADMTLEHAADQESYGFKREFINGRAYFTHEYAPVQDTEVESLHEAISCGFDLEAVAIDRVLMEELETALKSWKPWANELLKLYLEGKGRSCTISLSEKYHITDRAIQKRKTAFEKFVVDFLKK